MKNRKKGFTYILTNKTRSVLYVGVTSNLQKRLKEHITGTGSAFTAKYNVKNLIYFEQYQSIQRAIEREKQLKNWKRDWKLELIRTANPKLQSLNDKIHLLTY